jgi:hypothetical protein
VTSPALALPCPRPPVALAAAPERGAHRGIQ